MLYHLIINPHAGNKDQREIIRLAKQKFANRRLRLTVSETKKQGDAISITRGSEADVIIAGGGDGTVNEVINGIANKKGRARLAILPLGTANMFARCLHIPKKPEGALDIIFKGRTKDIDIGRINGRCFVLVAGIGIDAHMYRNVQPAIKKAFGEVIYHLSAVRTIFEYEPKPIRVKTKDMELTGYYVIVCNIGRYGHAIHIAPRARIDDGLLDVIVFEKKDTADFLKYAFGIITKRHGLFGDVKRIQTKRLTITADEKVLAHADAEIIGTTPAEVEVLEKHLCVICGEKKRVMDEKVIHSIKKNVEAFVKDRVKNMESPLKGGNKILKRIKDIKEKYQK